MVTLKIPGCHSILFSHLLVVPTLLTMEAWNMAWRIHKKQWACLSCSYVWGPRRPCVACSADLWDLWALLSPSSLLSRSVLSMLQVPHAAEPLPMLLPLPGSLLPTVMSFRFHLLHDFLREPSLFLQVRYGPTVKFAFREGLCHSLPHHSIPGT